jgi:hypothetical protein
MRFTAGQIEDDVGAAVAVVVSAALDADPRCIPDTDRR